MTKPVKVHLRVGNVGLLCGVNEKHAYGFTKEVAKTTCAACLNILSRTRSPTFASESFLKRRQPE